MPDLTRPPPFRRGDRVGVFAPASPPRQPSDLQRGLTALRERFEVVTLRSFDGPPRFSSDGVARSGAGGHGLTIWCHTRQK